MRRIADPGNAPQKSRLVARALMIGFGTFFLVAAALFRFTVPSHVVKFPLNEYEIMTLEGTGLSYFSQAQLTELSGVRMQATYTIKATGAPPRSLTAPDAAVWRSFLAIEDLTSHAPVQYTYQQLAMDRRTGRLVNWSGNVIGSSHLASVGGQGYVWPFGTQKRSYQIFDTTMRRPVTVRYAGTANTAGVTTYRFVEQVSGERIGTQTLPGSLVGLPARSVTLPEFYTATNSYWVDPVTGNPLKVSESQTLTLRDSAGATRLVLLHGTLTTTPASVNAVTAADKSNLSKIAAIEVIIPAIAGLLGLILLAAGLLIGRRAGPVPGSARHEEITPAPAGSGR